MRIYPLIYAQAYSSSNSYISRKECRKNGEYRILMNHNKPGRLYRKLYDNQAFDILKANPFHF